MEWNELRLLKDNQEVRGLLHPQFELSKSDFLSSVNNNSVECIYPKKHIPINSAHYSMVI